jgi:hypothetical protein
MRRNFFIFMTKLENMGPCMRHCLYGADVRRPDERSFGNAKPGDLALIWVSDAKKLYGIFEVAGEIFYDATDIGWSGDWPYRCQLRLWDRWLRDIRDQSQARLMSFVSKELTTLTDLSQLGGYIHTLFYDEGSKLFRFFMANSEMHEPLSLFNDFGKESKRPIGPPLDFAIELSKNSSAEYALEMHLLHDRAVLEELVGSGITELYNMVFGYQNRYLDIMAIHRDELGNMMKTTILELKAKMSKGDLERALDELTFYMFWTKDQIEKGKLTGDIGTVHGILVSPFKADQNLLTYFHDLTASYSARYGIDSRRIQWVGYEVTGQGSGTKLTFRSIE